MPTPGVDCHVTLQHASVNGGEAVGFILRADRRGPLVVVARARRGLALWADQGPGVAVARCTILALPRLVTPGGGEYALSVAEVRAALTALWAVAAPLTLTDTLGTLTVAWADDGLHERRYGDGAEYELRLVVAPTT